MANQEQLDILKQGVEIWNKWRKEYRTVKIELFGANLSDCNLKNANLRECDLRGVTFSGANLSGANLRGSILTQSFLAQVDLTQTNLELANLSSADLWNTTLIDTLLRETEFHNTNIAKCNFASVDLSLILHLDTVKHMAPSRIGRETLALSKGMISESFLRGCGFSDWEIESAKLHNPNLTNDEISKIQYRIYDLRATQAIQIAPLFISYSHADTGFVDHLDSALTQKGVRFWRDIHDAKAGRLETQIDRAIRQNPTVLLILSKNSLNSDWVQHEVRKARELEKELGRDALCPVALDDSWKSSKWPARLMEQIMEYHILDFSDWDNPSAFNDKFTKLLSGLDLFYKKPAA
jgi:uncharacterized protein YjbI with pentapeptide repeats